MATLILRKALQFICKFNENYFLFISFLSYIASEKKASSTFVINLNFYFLNDKAYIKIKSQKVYDIGFR